MLDNITQKVETKDVAAAIRAIAGMLMTEDQLTKKKVVDAAGKMLLVCPGMITRIAPKTLYNPQREGVEVFYVNGDRFSVDLTTEALAEQLGLG
ncbi:hypothetical protein [Marinobacter sp. P4B1]|uniref:hypothetical protein n=1 Tax=Marinobacter sp. P4B1 TaxID=1119533 RepID=UPI00071CF4ED|nr:hypothetical protein [Marinobacter sp. P4B1]KRW83647.1 hypothetical protein AQ621_16495 [Marinobacter sp. P4B1]